MPAHTLDGGRFEFLQEVDVTDEMYYPQGCIWSFQATFTYLVDAFRPVAASAMAANSAMRSTFACIFPLFTSEYFFEAFRSLSLIEAKDRLADLGFDPWLFSLATAQMFARLGTQWSLALCAFLCLAMVPFPFLVSFAL